MAKDAESGEHVESVQLTKGQRFKRHCARRWWMWLIGFIVSAVVIVVIIIYAIVPAVAQKTLDNTVLHVDSLKILDPTPEQFQISVVSHITGSSKIAHKAKLDPMDAAFSLEGGETFLVLPLPGIHGGDNILVEKINHTAKIENPTSFATFAATLMDSQEFKMNVNGKTKIHLGSINAKVDYRETVTLKGFNKLSGMVITSYQLVLDSEDHNMVGKVRIPNPTVFTLQVGDVGLDIAMDGEHLGTGVLNSLTIVPGDVEYDFKALLESEKLTKAAGKILTGEAILQIRAKGAIVNGVDIPWLSKPLSSLVADVPVQKLEIERT